MRHCCYRCRTECDCGSFCEELCDLCAECSVEYDDDVDYDREAQKSEVDTED